MQEESAQEMMTCALEQADTHLQLAAMEETCAQTTLKRSRSDESEDSGSPTKRAMVARALAMPRELLVPLAPVRSLPSSHACSLLSLFSFAPFLACSSVCRLTSFRDDCLRGLRIHGFTSI